MAKKYTHIKIRLASSKEILKWSHGEVKKHETINYRTLKPEDDGLFCEKIFGPRKDHQCACGKRKRSVDKGKKCEKCGVEITESKVRRERMGHIVLQAPVVHTWYLKNSPSVLATLLDIKSKTLEEVVYLAAYIVIDPGNTDLKKNQVIQEQEYYRYLDTMGNRLKALTGAEAVKKLLQDIDLEQEAKVLRRELKTSSKQKREKVIKRLDIVEAFINSDNKPEWMVLDVLPVIPPDIRPMVQLDGGRFATTDLNDLYRRILNRNNRLKKQMLQNAPHLITKNEKRMLQEAVDALIDNSKRGKRTVVEKNRPLKSLSDMLRGKQGRFRQNLLGKRVDYSGRSVIVVGPDLEMYQCGIPKQMALLLFKPFVIKEIMNKEEISISNAKKLCDRQDDSVWPILEEVISEHPVLLNRAPTLHRLGIQAFEPKLIEGKAIRLHPLVTTAFNADFDGDQMAVHVPLSHEAQAEARLLMLASNNILNPKDGKPVVTPSQDMVLGNFYLTMEKEGLPNESKIFRNFEEAQLAFGNDEITLHTKIFIDANSLKSERLSDKQRNSFLRTTYGKLIFNRILPASFNYLNEPSDSNLLKVTPDKYFVAKGENAYEAFNDIETVKPFDKKFLSKIIGQVFKTSAINETSKMLDKLKDFGFEYSTVAGFTVSASDVKVYSGKKELIEKSDQVVDSVRKIYDRGLLTDDERKKLITSEWGDTRLKIQEGLMQELLPTNHIRMMSDSGARGNASNFSQLAGMRGLMNNTKGEAMEIPVKASFREGLTVSEFFISTHGARKGSTDTALKTAESGYLTRRLVDVSQDVIVEMEDCQTDRGLVVEDIRSITDDKLIVPLEDRLVGRYANKTVRDSNGKAIVERNQMITFEISNKIQEEGIKEVEIRSTLTCDAINGVCKKCYGNNLATNHPVEVGEVVGIIAAQSIGEPGTQLTMRTFHTGGVASASDITQGLPRIQELFEARNPKGNSEIAECNGIVSNIEDEKNLKIITLTSEIDDEEFKYKVPKNSNMLVDINDKVTLGQKLIEGNIAPKELLRVTSSEEVQKYILKEVQKVYRAQGVEISDKHIEIIIRQMLRKILIISEGDTELLPGAEVSISKFKSENKRMLMEDKTLAVGRPILHGITRASLRSESFLSAASFQETTRILTEAAIKGKIDPLVGLKENVIIGGLIPAGTGLLKHSKFEYDKPVADDFNNDEGEEDIDSGYFAEENNDDSDFDDFSSDINDSLEFSDETNFEVV